MSASGGIPKARNFAPTSRQDTGRSATRQVSSEAIRIRTALFVWPRTEPDPSAARTVKRNAGAQCIRNLTVKLRGRTTTPQSAEGAQSLSARGAKPTAPRGPLQRLLEGEGGLTSLPKQSIGQVEPQRRRGQRRPTWEEVYPDYP